MQGEEEEEEANEFEFSIYGPPTALAQEGASQEHSSNPGLLYSSDTQPYNVQTL